jgi:hypothetical protein
MDEDEKRRLTVAKLFEWTASTTLAPDVYQAFVLDLWVRGKIRQADVLDLIQAYSDRLPSA